MLPKLLTALNIPLKCLHGQSCRRPLLLSIGLIRLLLGPRTRLACPLQKTPAAQKFSQTTLVLVELNIEMIYRLISRGLSGSLWRDALSCMTTAPGSQILTCKDTCKGHGAVSSVNCYQGRRTHLQSSEQSEGGGIKCTSKVCAVSSSMCLPLKMVMGTTS